MLGISVIPRDSDESGFAKNSSTVLERTKGGGYSPIYRGVRAILMIWLMIYYLEETFICSSGSSLIKPKMVLVFMRNGLI